MDGEDRAEVTTALLLASRALVAIAARSLDDLDDDITLPQFRALVVLQTRGSLNLTTLAAEVGIHVSTANRLCNRLVESGLIHRLPSADSGREVTIEPTAAGHRLISTVMRRRKREIARIVDALTPRQRRGVVNALQAFADAAGEPPQQHWSWGWPS